MRLSVVLAALFVLLGLAMVPSAQARQTECLVCVTTMLIFQQNAEQNPKETAKVLAETCYLLPTQYRSICHTLVANYGYLLLEYYADKVPADLACSRVGVCQECIIHRDTEVQLRARRVAALMEKYVLPAPERAAARHTRTVLESSPNTAKIDVDGDGFSPSHESWRGADWRGKDCNDHQAAVRPGVLDNPRTANIDLNCNGIYGYDDKGRSYESLYCNETQVRSMVTFGDSVGAAFTIPPEWILFKNLSQVLPDSFDELDHPQLSAWSGWAPEINGQSLYGQLLSRNRCNHRDYQNLAVNGATMHDLASYQVDGLTPTEKPIFAYIGYVGNDVCKSSLDRMTTPSVFRTQFIAGLSALSAKATKPSYVVALGLVDGRILWDTLHNLTHPLGVTYAQFYEFLTCTGANPCTTWLNPDASIRDATSLRAAELSKQMADVAANMRFPNLSVYYIDFVEILKEALVEIDQMGMPRSALFSPMDGFHPSLFPGHRILADKVWGRVIKNRPEFVGAVNPFNEVIGSLFGNQGGF